MSDDICINYQAVEKDASLISGVAEYFRKNALVPEDAKTTLTANSAGKQTYNHSQEVIALLGENMEREVLNIRGIGVTFKQYDEMLTELMKSGMRYPVITSMK